MPFAKFKNELIGGLCSELAEGEELNKACLSWNKRIDPVNYMKAVAPITEKQKQAARLYVEENGLVDSFARRFANINDIKVSEILHSNIGEDKIKSISMFDGVKTTSTRHKRSEFKDIEEVSIERFMKDILPSCTSVEAYLTNIQEDNMVSLTTADVVDSKSIFKWNNNYSWTYNGNLAGKSMIKNEVAKKGGAIDGVLGIRLAWNINNIGDGSDLDLWASEPNREQIGFNTEYRKDKNGPRTSMSGQLDVDNTCPGGKIAVENIVWNNKNQMKDGVYKLWVNQFNGENPKGFTAEIEFDGEIYTYEYNKPLGHKQNVQVAEVTLKNGEFSIKHLLPETHLTKELYDLQTNEFHKVNLICLSPNHWGENNIGNKHYFFMLDKCKCPTSIRSFHAENLLPDIAKHRAVLEVLGAVNMIEPTEKQLSGIGFNATVKEELVVKLQGSFKRIIKIKF